MLLLSDGQLEARRSLATGALAPLADSLAADLAPVITRPLYVPERKALLSKIGGRCETDGTALTFDPFSPNAHTCPACGRVHGGEFHDRWWIYPYQLWLAERAVHGGLLHLLTENVGAGRLAHDILLRYADLYASYPNLDNVLGPTRLFFSTYLESIWLLQICVATDLLAAAGDNFADRILDSIVEPSAELIEQFDEGYSNRQVWNNAALMAAALLKGDRSKADSIVSAPSGVAAHLSEGLLEDGTWYEGENYHQFAHRGLWYCVTLTECAGVDVDPTLLDRFNEGFATPFLTALPDFTLPARKDSQYAVSLHQWRFAELCELGLARTGDARLYAALTRLYGGEHPSGDTGRARSTADVESNVPPTGLSRADLGWRALLHALPDTHRSESRLPMTTTLERQGITVFRRDEDRVYVALDWGQSGGGHGHPDRLNVLFSYGAQRLLDDYGTGSYVDRSLHWYRSTLAHNAPLVYGRSQERIAGALLAYEEQDGIGWVHAEADIAPGVRVERAIVVTEHYYIDEVRWEAPEDVRFELPIHVDADTDLAGFVSDELDGGDGLEDGFGFAHDAESVAVDPMQIVTLAARGDSGVRAWIGSSRPARWFRAVAPGPPLPGSGERSFYVIRCEGTGGVVKSVWAWSSVVANVAFMDEKVEIDCNGERYAHSRSGAHWRMETRRGSREDVIVLQGARELPRSDFRSVRPIDTVPPLELFRGVPLVFDLGERHYRRSEETWSEAGRPHAKVTLTATDDSLSVDLEVDAGPVVVVQSGAENQLDNEHADINGHGVQLYLLAPPDGGAWLVSPDDTSNVARVRSLSGWGSVDSPRATWKRRPEGFDMHIDLALPSHGVDRFPFSIDVIVNETTPDRVRRRGQLVMSGAGGEFVYLRGDRHDRRRLITMVVTTDG